MIISVLTRNPGNWEPFEELQISSLPELVSYVKKIALHAYKTTDEVKLNLRLPAMPPDHGLSSLVEVLQSP